MTSPAPGGPVVRLRSVADYARHTALPVAFLERLGIRTGRWCDGSPCVVIPYRDAAGQVVRLRLRRDQEHRWGPGTGILPVGLEQLAAAPPGRAVLLVEGETDALVCWWHRVLALGVPGASVWPAECTPLVAGRRVYVWEEPAPSGPTFVRTLAPHVPGALVVPHPPAVKDLRDLHRLNPAGFRVALARLVERAGPLPALPGTPPAPLARAPRLARDTGAVERARAVPILEVAHRLGLGEPRREGRELVVQCPLHPDHHPDLKLNPAKGVWYCHPCGEGGDVIRLVQRALGLAFRDAVRWLERGW